MTKPLKIFPLLLVVLFSLYALSVAADVPSTPLHGMTGLEQAKEIQFFTKKPIILFSTWNTCSQSKKVEKWFSSSQINDSLKDYPRVILESRGNEDEETESQIKGFKGGRFYVIHDYDTDSLSAVNAWESGGYKIKSNLLSLIKSKIN